ncbi:Rha family transcriptional regulator [Stenotrophomonas beteli]|uniref:Uncharacterized protein n=1 Tax=Stenotrophomonas beteli TaxID=3384461 RepID=A0A0R0B637_9GAMM|nr:Rha family transcriptional regulator [Stenotrophomonas maltophilia]KRG52717.1 hypothetical protein ARC23_04250 [Stenotrophomonas maltophilia]
MNGLDHASEVVMLSGKHVMTDSRKVAEAFGKRHAHVTRKIRGLMKKLPEGGAPIFGHTPYIDSHNGETYDLYQMNKDGFMLLVMGFTGDEALKVKLEFIAAFNEMAEFVRAQVDGALQRWEVAYVEYRADLEHASRCGKDLSNWRGRRLVHLARLEQLDPQIKLPLIASEAA